MCRTRWRDLKAALASVAGDAAFAEDFFARFIQGHELVNYESLLARAGFVLRLASPGRAFAGQLRVVDIQGRPRVTGPAPLDSPAYRAGLDHDDVILSVGGTEVASAADVERLIHTGKPGDEVPLVFERRGQRINASLRLGQDPLMEIVRAEDIGRVLTPPQQRFRQSWLSSRARNTF